MASSVILLVKAVALVTIQPPATASKGDVLLGLLLPVQAIATTMELIRGAAACGQPYDCESKEEGAYCTTSGLRVYNDHRKGFCFCGLPPGYLGWP